MVSRKGVCVLGVAGLAPTGVLVAAVAAAVVACPYKRLEPVCLTAEYWPGRVEVFVVFDLREEVLPRLCRVEVA